MRHITLDTGHVRESPRSEVSDEAVTQVQSYLRAALEAGRRGEHIVLDGVRLYPPHPQRVTLAATRSRNLLLTTVYGCNPIGGGGSPVPAPLATVAVAPTEEGAAGLWDLIHARKDLDLATRGLAAPAAPWCAVSLQLGLALYPQAAEWLGDLERCIAWAWMADEARRH